MIVQNLPVVSEVPLWPQPCTRLNSAVASREENLQL